MYINKRISLNALVLIFGDPYFIILMIKLAVFPFLKKL